MPARPESESDSLGSWPPKRAFGLEAQQYYDAGFIPLPLVPRPLVPALYDWATYADGMPLSVFQAILEDKRLVDAELGLVLGSRHGEHRLVAVVVRDAILIPDVTAALGATPCAVRTPGRLTIFAVTMSDLRLRRFRRRDPVGRWEATRLTVEGRGRHVVLPPTRLPVGQCSWVGRPLLEVGIDSLPRLTAQVLDELQAIAEGPGEPFRSLNALGPEDGDEARQAAVADLVARRWPDEAVPSRVGRAVEEAQVRAGEAGEVPGLIELIPTWVQEARRKMMPRPSAREVTQWWLEARGELLGTRSERAQWWTRSSVAYQDCVRWAEAQGYSPPHEVAWGTTLTGLGAKSAVRKTLGRSIRMRNLALKS